LIYITYYRSFDESKFLIELLSDDLLRKLCDYALIYEGLLYESN